MKKLTKIQERTKKNEEWLKKLWKETGEFENGEYCGASVRWPVFKYEKILSLSIIKRILKVAEKELFPILPDDNGFGIRGFMIHDTNGSFLMGFGRENLPYKTKKRQEQFLKEIFDDNVRFDSLPRIWGKNQREFP